MMGCQWTPHAGVTPSLETRAKISRALMGNRNGAAKRGCTPTPEARARQRDSISAWWQKRREAEGIPQRWREIAAMRAEGMTLQDIGSEFGISPQRVAQLLQKHRARVSRGEAA